ncbi:MAG: helix-turn-helix transcriptional regulator, partial [Verrucomicrobiae bacterium]|nr:helix-turn-helix transcriptional regulator [Verrucomicrobiae bacterium]
RLFRNQTAGPDRPVHGPVKHVLQLLRGRLDQPLDLSALAREVGVSPHHLSRLVRAESGATLQHHLRRLRVEHACGLLDSGRANVTEAAYSCGYQSLSHFAKAFREETGRTPREWLAERQRE